MRMTRPGKDIRVVSVFVVGIIAVLAIMLVIALVR